MGETKNTYYKILVEKPEGKSPLERPRERNGGNIKMYHNNRLKYTRILRTLYRVGLKVICRW
jgi:hypothetical protein